MGDRQNAAIVTYNCSWNYFTDDRSYDNHHTHNYKHEVYYLNCLKILYIVHAEFVTVIKCFTINKFIIKVF